MKFLSRFFGSKRSPQMVASDLVAEVKKAVGNDLVSVFIYGSVASGEFAHGRSNINVLVITKKLDAATLHNLQRASAAWKGGHRLRPLFLSNEEVQNWAEVFPIEFLDIQDHRRLLFGEDPFRKMAINRKNLRHQLEFEIKSKLLKFRQEFLFSPGSEAAIRELAGQTFTSLVPIFRGLMRLKKQRPARERARLVQEVAKLFNLSQDTFQQAMELRYGQAVLAAGEARVLFEKLLGELETLALLIGRMDADGNVNREKEKEKEGAQQDKRGGREGRERERGGRDRERGREKNENVANKKEKLAEVMALINQEGASAKKRWEPKEADRFQSDPMSRDTSRPVDERFGWDRNWKRNAEAAQGVGNAAESFGWDREWRNKERKERFERRVSAQQEGGTKNEGAEAAPISAPKPNLEALPEERLSVLAGPKPVAAPVEVEKKAPEARPVEIASSGENVGAAPASSPAPEAVVEKPAEPKPSPRPVSPALERLPEEKFNW